MGSTAVFTNKFVVVIGLVVILTCALFYAALESNPTFKIFLGLTEVIVALANSYHQLSSMGDTKGSLGFYDRLVFLAVGTVILAKGLKHLFHPDKVKTAE